MPSEIAELEGQIFEMTKRLAELRAQSPGIEVRNYSFDTLGGQTTLSDLFGDQNKLLMIHNMGQGCRYCTLWGDGLNGFIQHIESTMALAMVSKDEPELQRRFANSRGWRFHLASHGGGEYIKQQTVMEGADNMPGSVIEILYFGVAAGFMYLGTVVRSRTLLFSSVIALMGFTGYFFRDSLANAFGLIIMGFLLIGLSAFAMSLNRKYIQTKL